ncbi:MAG: hypothetical protein ACAI35_24635 [Candidatus Methylacidiphilales bacterium]
MIFEDGPRVEDLHRLLGVALVAGQDPHQRLGVSGNRIVALVK